MKIIIIDLESVETRYTCQWKHGFPKLLNDEIRDRGKKNIEVINISGGETPQDTTPGAFLNFSGTNVYKCSQGVQLSTMFADGKITNGDHIIFMDAWNPFILQTKYMVDLLGISVKLHGFWHAGSYDPHDFLGRHIPDKSWSYDTERAMFHAIDYNYFATKFHIDLFVNTLFPNGLPYKTDKNTNSLYQMNGIYLCGQPHNILVETLEALPKVKKKNKILFPHRVAPEKQPDIFRFLAKELPQYEFIICQDRKLTKDQYHDLLNESKAIFSANHQETLGISAMEAILVDTIPIVPDRLSYSEMYLPPFKYDTMLTDYHSSDITMDKGKLEQMKNIIINIMENGVSEHALGYQKEILKEKYLTPKTLLDILFSDK